MNKLSTVLSFVKCAGVANVGGIFVMLFVGLALAVVVAVVEFVWNAKHNRSHCSAAALANGSTVQQVGEGKSMQEHREIYEQFSNFSHHQHHYHHHQHHH